MSLLRAFQTGKAMLLLAWKCTGHKSHYMCKGLLRGRSYKVQMTALDLDVHYRCYAERSCLFEFIPTSEL